MHIRASLLIALLAIFGGPLSAQYATGIQIDQPSALRPVAFDADNDGDLDVVFMGDHLCINMNMGQGLFSQFKWISAPRTNYTDIGVSDMDMDGDLDLVIIGRVTDTASFWLANDSTGEFSFGAILPFDAAQTNPYTRQQYVDINGDSLPDIFMSTQNAGRLSMNHWPAAFGPLGSTLGGIPLVADIDLNGMLDVVGRSGTRGIRWWKDIYGPEDTVGDLANTLDWLEVFDVDQDGDSDVVALASAGRMDVLLNDTATGFAPGFSTTCEGLFNYRTQRVDLDGDGFTDLVLHATSGKLIYMRNVGDGTFAPPVDLFTLHGKIPLYFADINTDGVLDLVTEGLTWFEGLPSLQFGPGRNIAFLDAPNGVVSWGDMDGDGDIDIVKGGNWLEQVAPLSFGLVHTIQADAKWPAPADLNGDGQMDCFTFWVDGYDSGLIQYMHGEEGAWADTSIIAGYGERSEVLTWDPDGDGDVDLLQGIFGNGVRAFRNDGQGVFSLVTLVGNNAAQAYRPAVADFDGDGDEDFAAIGSNGLMIHRNSGNWDFSLNPSFVTTASWGGGSAAIKHIRSADMDLDGSPDLVIDKGGKLSWFANFAGNGTGWAQHALDIPVSVDFFGFDLADVDMDGDIDILYLPPFASNPLFGIALNWLSNDGQGGFSAPQVIIPTGNDQIIGVRAVDVDADMDPDLLVTIAPNGSYPNRTLLLIDTVDFTLDLPRAERPPRFRAFPVPADHSVTIQPGQEPIGKGWFSLSDPQGRLLRTWKADSPGALTIQRAGLAKGLYLLSLRSPGKAIYTTRIVFQ